MAAGDLTDIETVRRFLGLKTLDDDGLIQSLVTAASGYVNTYVSRAISPTSFVDVFNGAPNGKVFLANRPVISVTSVSYLGVTIPVALPGATDAGYLLDTSMGLIQFRGLSLYKSIGGLVVTYTAGWASTPTELAQAVVEMVAFRMKERGHWGQDSASNAGQSVSFTQEDIPRAARTMLDQYKRVVPV